jgi:mannose-6-phosphate isomerase
MPSTSEQSAPSRIAPIFLTRIWGARSLAPLFPEKVNLAEPLGEVWLTAVDCRMASGPYEGKFLGAAWREMPSEWRGSALAHVSEFPILVKFIFPADKLSIQVHPDDAYASVNEQAAGGRGKTEMWHAVTAQPEARVLIGLKPGVDREKFLKALDARTLEQLFEAHPVNPGDTFFIPAGTPHAIGPHMVLCEIQEYSDLTYRVYDYGRTDVHGNPRELHITKALEVTDFTKTRGGGRVLHPRDFAGAQLRPGPGGNAAPPLGSRSSHLLAACPFFSATRQDFVSRIETRSTPERFEVAIILSGAGSIEWHGKQAKYQAGECWFIPASLGTFAFQAESATAVIRATVPDLTELRGTLLEEGMPVEQLEKVLFT